MFLNLSSTLIGGLLSKKYKWVYVILCLFVVLLVYLADLNHYYWGIRSVYWPIISLWLFFKIESFFIVKTSKNNYFKFNFQTIKLNLYLILIFSLIFIVIYFNKLYPQGDLTNLNRGIPNLYFPFLYAFLSVPLQQDMFFGELYNRLSTFSNVFRYFFISCFYSLTHIYYPQPQLILLVTFGLGLYWVYCRQKSQSVWGNILAQIVIGLTSFALNFA